MKPNSKDAYKLLHDGVLALSRIEQNGIRVDTDYIKRKKIEITQTISELENQFYETKFFKDWEKSTISKVNINSPQQLRQYLYITKKYKIPKETESG